MLVAIPCAGADCLLLLDATDGTSRGCIPVGSHPVHLEAISGAVFVATMGERAVTVVEDGDVTRVETGTLGPSHFGVTDAGRVLVPCTGGDSLAIIDRETLSLVDRVGVGAEPHDVAVHAGLAFVGSRTDGTVSVVDPAAGRLVRTVDLGAGARVQGVDAGFGAVYAVDQASGRIARLNATGVTATAQVGSNPYEVVLGDERLFVAGRDDGTVTVLTPGLSVLQSVDVGGRPTSVVPVGGTPWVLNREAAELRTLDGHHRIDIAAPGFTGASREDADAMVVVHYDDDRVSLVSTSESKTVWSVRTPKRPFDAFVL